MADVVKVVLALLYILFVSFKITSSQKIACYDVERHPNAHLLPLEFGRCGRRKIANASLGSDLQHRAARGEFPWIVYLEITLKTGQSQETSETVFCSGVIISKHYIIMAAHCLDGGNITSKTVKIYTPPDDKTRETEDCVKPECLKDRNFVDAEKIIVHEEFDKTTRKNNIALLRVKEPFVFDNYVQPACLPLTCHLQSSFAERKQTLQLGWNIYKNGSASNVPYLQKVLLNVQPRGFCLKYDSTGTPLPLDDTVFCVHRNSYVCKAREIGAPIFLAEINSDEFDELFINRYTLFGLPQSGPGCNESSTDRKSVTYTRVAPFIKWILYNIYGNGEETRLPRPDLKSSRLPGQPLKYKCSDASTLMLLPKECGVVQKTLRASSVELREADMGAHPWTVQVLNDLDIPGNKKEVIICNGALISSRFVLTAAHCLTLSPPSRRKETGRRLTVVAGDYIRNNPRDCLLDNTTMTQNCYASKTLEVGKYFIHGKFNPYTRRNDIALLHLAQEVMFTKWIQPICLPVSCFVQEDIRNVKNIPDPIFRYMVQSGWQIYKPPEKALTDVMQEVVSWGQPIDLNITGHKETSCSEYLWLDNYTQYCALTLLFTEESTRYGPTCDPYTGGPLTSMFTGSRVLMGILSYGESCDYTRDRQDRDAAIYTKVTAYLHWILERMVYSTFNLEDPGDKLDYQEENYNL